MSMHLVRSVAVAALVATLPPARAGAPAPDSRPSLAEPSMSPDGREIAFVSGGDIWTAPAAGGEARLLVSHAADERRPLWSPDGTRLAFISTRTGNGDIYVLTLATGELRRITFDDILDQLDAWSRDGKWLYFSSTSRDISGMNDVWRVAATGGTPMQVAADRYAAEFWGAPSPDGKTLAITARGTVAGQWWRKGHSHLDESEIWLVRNAAPGEAGPPAYEPVTTGGAKSAWPMWSPDGATLYFMSDRSGAENLWSRPASGGDARQLTKFSGGRLLWPTISYDGKTVVFERDFGIWSYDVAGGQARQLQVTLRGAPAGASTDHVTLAGGFQEMALSPDGKKVAVVGRGEIFAASARDGGDAVRVTQTPAAEGQLDWAPDSRRLAYASDRDGSWHLFLYDFGTRAETQLTKGDNGFDVTPRWSPDGRLIAYVHAGRELRVLDPVARTERLVATADLDRPPFLTDRGIAWSPDSRWIAYSVGAGPRLLTNVFVVPASGGESRQVSWLSQAQGGTVVWSPDGTYLLVNTAQRTEQVQLARIDLVPRTPRFREDQFRDLFNPEVPKPVSPPAQPGQPPAVPRTPRPAPADSVRDTSRVARADTAPLPNGPTTRGTRIVFDDIRRRVSFVETGLDVGAPTLSPDGKQLAFVAGVAGQANIYVYPMDELSREQPVARQVTSTPGFKSSLRWSPDSKELYFLENGRVSSVSVDSRSVRPVAVTGEMDVEFASEKREVFDQVWTVLRDNFFDERMNGVDWGAVRETYAPQVAGARTGDELRRVLSLMLGELNASHMGMQSQPPQSPYTGRLGVRFDRAEYEKSGRLRISEIIPLGPLALTGGVAVGDFIVGVDGRPIDAGTNLDELLAYHTNRQTTLSIASASGASRHVVVRPVSAGTEKGLLYRAWVEDRRAYVAKASGGRLGYVHMFDMGQGSLNQLYADLDAENVAREGVIIDVRNNNGGFVNAYALDVLARRPYLTMQPRGTHSAPARTLLGQRALELPTILVTNMHSLSDAEDFTEGYRAMHLGKVVGEPTAGWIIYTSAAQLVDGSAVRLPFIRITDAAGKDMELHPRPVDVQVVRPVGESYTGRDSQLDAAVRELLAQLGTTRKATDGSH